MDIFYNDISHKPSVDATVRYVESTDYIEVYRGNEWLPYRKAGYSELVLVKDGVINQDYPWGGSSTFTYVAASGELRLEGSASVANLVATTKVDLTTFSTLTIICRGYTQCSCGVFQSQSGGMITGTKINGTSTKYTIDVNSLDGEYFIGSQVYNSSNKTFIKDIILS